MKNTLQNNITIRYAVALSLIALLSIFAYVTLRASIQSSESLAYIVNISGKQRMLSQHIALDVNRLYNVLTQEKNILQSKIIKNMILKNVTVMDEANKALSTGQFVAYSDNELSQEIYNLYHGPTDVANRVKEYTSLALQATQTNSLQELKEILDEISLRSEPLLIDLNQIVQQYQKEGEESIAFIKNIETTIVIATLFILLLEVLLIFQPMVRNIVTLTNEKNTLLNDLKNQVDIKTKDLQTVNEKLKQLAYYDPLTSLRNRMTLEQDIEDLITGKHQFCVLMMDIDYFKDLNDTFGHDFGDHVLEVFAKIFKNTFRDEDRIYRVGGEEFVVLLKGVKINDAQTLASKCKTRISSHNFHVDGKHFQKTISIGLYDSIDNHAKSFKDVYSNVDSALYHAKNNGRNRVEVFHPRHKLQDTQSQFVETLNITLTPKPPYIITGTSQNIENILQYKFGDLEQNSTDIEMILHKDDHDLLHRSNFKNFTARFISKNQQTFVFRVELIQSDTEITLHLYKAVELVKNIPASTIISNFHAMMDESDDYIYFKDKNHLFTAASKSLVHLTNVKSKDDLIGKTDYEVFPKEYADLYYKLEKDVFHNNIEIAQEIQAIEDNAGNRGVVDNRKYPIKDENGEIIGLFGIARVFSD